MKRFLIVLLAALACLTGCSSKTPSDATSAAPSDQSNTTPSDDPKTTTLPSDLSSLFAPTVREDQNYTVGALTENGSYIAANYATVDGATVQKYPRLTNLATLYLNFPNDRGLDAVQHGIYTDATYTFVDQYVEDSYYELPLQIKGRGNYSWSFAQKPYSLKLGEKADFLGMGAAKKWTLITVSSDHTMMHNYLTQKMAAAMGLRGTCENEYVDVVVNGEYAGTWVLTEKIQIHEERIDVPDDVGVLFEIEMVYRHTCDTCIILYEDSNRSNSVHLRLKTYKGVDLEDMDQRAKDAALAELQPFFNGLSDAFTREKTLEAISQYIDVDSFVNWYLLNELTRNYDSQFVTSCYCYIDETGRLYMGPVWDFDTCYGTQDPQIDGYRVKNAPWYTQLFECEAFVRLVCERWTELKNNGLIDAFCASIDQTALRIAASEQLNHALYPHSELGSSDFDEAVEYFKSWLDARIAWMDGEFLLTGGTASAIPSQTTTAATTTRRPRG
ncbi:MAG: CotH kinase family protein [Clostridia bacterium]|nr:CotH kinase family protein [Clostridia bacterium]